MPFPTITEKTGWLVCGPLDKSVTFGLPVVPATFLPFEEDVWLIEYNMYDKGYHGSQIAAVCGSLERAEKWLRDEIKGKSWSHLAFLEGEGERLRLITNFGPQDYTTYDIRKKPFLR